MVSARTVIIQKAPNNRLHTDAALRASANGRFKFCVVSVSKGFQADARAARVKRTLGAVRR